MNARVRFKLNTCQRPDHLPLIGWLAHPQLRPRGRTLFHCQPIRLLSQLVNDRIMRHLQVERRPFWYACSSWAAASRASVSRSAARALASPRRCWKLKTTSAAHGSDVAIQVPLRCRRPGLFPLFRQSAATGMRLDRALWKPGETLRCVTPSPRHHVTTSPRYRECQPSGLQATLRCRRLLELPRQHALASHASSCPSGRYWFTSNHRRRGAKGGTRAFR